MQIEKILKNIVIGGVFALPFVVLIVVDSMFFPYVVGKNIAFRIIVEIIFSAWLALAIVYSMYRPKWTYLLLSLVTFVGITALADLFGENFYKSFWSNYERMEGLITLLHILAYVVVAQAVMVSEKLWLWFWRVSLALSFLISLHVIIQSFSSDAVRLYSTLGNPIYLAVYALFHIFIALVLAFRRVVLPYERYAYFATLPFLLYGVYLTSTRGATLGIIIGLIISAGGVAFSYRSNKKVLATSLVVAALIIASSIGFWAMRDSSFVRENNLLNRFASISLTDNSIFARTIVWKMAIDAIAERPLLGWGQENFNYVFNFNYDPRMHNFEPWYDRTHNMIFDWGIASGVFGLLAYLSIFLSLLVLIYKTTNFSTIQKWLLVGLLAAYGFQNLTVFDQIVSYILFFSVVAWTVAVTDDVWKRNEKIETGRDSTLLWVTLIIIPIVITLIITVNYKPVKANKLLLGGLSDANISITVGDRGDTQRGNTASRQALEKLNKASSLNTYGTQEINEQIAHTAKLFFPKEWIEEDIKQDWYRSAVRAMVFEKERTPLDARFPVFLADVHSVFGQPDLELKELERALELSPNKQTIILKIANNAFLRKDTEKALALSKEAYESASGNVLAELFYAASLIETGDIEGFSSLYEDGKHMGGDVRVLTVLVRNEEFVIAERIWEEYMINEGDPTAAFALVSAYDSLGLTSKAIQSVKRAIELVPGIEEDGERILKLLRI